MSLLRFAARRTTPLWLLATGWVPTCLVLIPIGYVAVRAIEAGPAGLARDVVRPYTLGLLVNTLTLTTSVTLLAAVIATAAAWCTERCDLPGAAWWRLATALPLAIPAYVSSFAWSSLGPRFQDMPGAILILTLYSVPLVYLPMVAAFRSLDPTYEDVARSLGHSRWRSFRRVILPQTGPALGGGALLVATHMLAEFGALSFLRVETFTTAIYHQYTNQFDNQAAALLSGVLVLIALPVAAGEAWFRGRRRVARSGRGQARRAEILRLGWWTPVALAGFALLAILGFAVPLATLANWVWIGQSRGDGIAGLGSAAATSFFYAVAGAGLTTLFAIPLVVMAAHHRGRMAAAADRLPYLVHGLPGIVVALAAISVTLAAVPALYQTTALMMLVYAVLFLPLAQTAIRASADLVPRELIDVARNLGRRPLHAFLSAMLPNLLPGLAAAFALTTLQMMRELTATLLLAPAGVVTLATEFWNFAADRAYGAAAPFAATLVLVSGLPVYVVTAYRLRPDAAP